MIKKIFTAISIMFFCGTALASNTATQTIKIKVEAISVISVSGDPGILLISDGRTSATDDSTTYAITTNETNKKIIAKIDKELPEGLTLKVHLDPPEGAVASEVALNTSPQDVVTDISRVAESGMKILYTLTSDGRPAEDSVEVVFTIVDG